MEQEFIEYLKSRIDVREQPDVLIGVGDDAAVLRRPNHPLVVTTDSIVEGIHFRRQDLDYRTIGRKALAVNLSDIAAMGSLPQSYLMTLVISSEQTLQDCQDIVEGMLELGNQYSIALVGGDFVAGAGQLSINVSVIGAAVHEQLWRIDAAQLGDRILVSGQLGGSILGKHALCDPRFDLVNLLQPQFAVNAATDISDGLVIDLQAICDASRVGAELDLKSVPVSEAAHQRSQQDGQSALEHALYDGEDFELILVASPNVAKAMLREPAIATELTYVGEIVDEPGIRHRLPDDRLEAIEVRGYRHDV